ncbi:hypothetical protein JCM3774_004831 [Rhodotorula dairenensis]
MPAASAPTSPTTPADGSPSGPSSPSLPPPPTTTKEVLMLESSSSDNDDGDDGAHGKKEQKMELDADRTSGSDAQDDEPKDGKQDGKTSKSQGKPKAKVKTATGKRKAATASSSSTAPAAKKVKTDSSKAAAAKAEPKVAEKPLVEIKKGPKLETRQKPLKTDFAQSYTTELHAFVAWAVQQLKDKGVKKLAEFPEEHHGFFAKLIHESPQSLVKLANSIKSTLVTAIVAGLSAACEDSQEMDESNWDETAVAERIPAAEIKTLIQQLATRTNFGLDPSDLADASTVPLGLQLSVWEVDDDKLWVTEFAARLEKRKNERREIKRAAVELFTSLPEAKQRALLAGKDPVASSSTAKDPKGKGKGGAQVDDLTNEEEGEDVKPDVKSKGKKKELTEEEKVAAEEKAAARAARDAEKEAKRKERDEKRAAKAEKDAAEQAKREEKAKIKAERQAEADKKTQLAKKQKSMFTSFFVKKSASPSPSEAGPSNSSPAGPATTSDFDRVFHPFTIRERVEVAPPNRFYRPNRSYEIEFDSRPDLTLKDSLSSFLSTASKRRIPPYNPYPAPALSVRQTVNAISDATLTSQDVSDLYDALKDPKKIKVKHFRFKEDLRPGYVGTWTKVSAVVGPRTPFARDTAILNYEHDSEAEWEEEADDPEAEELASDGERSGDEKDEVGSDVDSWLAEDDEIEYQEGYDAEGDVVMLAAENGGREPHDDDDDVVVVESDKVRKRKEREAKKRKAERERKKRREVMLPVAKGMFWQEDVEVVAEPALKTMRIQLLNDATFGLNPFTFASKPPFVTQSSASTSAAIIPAGKENVAINSVAPSDAGKCSVPTLTTGSVNTLKAKRPAPKTPFPPEQLPALLRMLHGSSKTKPVIVSEFSELMKSKSTPVPKVTVEAKLKEIDVKRVKNTYVVDAALLAQHGIPA